MSVDGPPASGSMPQLTPSLVGEVLGGRYRLLKKLGEGGMGEVYAAEHVHIEKKFAIKLLRPEIVSNKEAVKRFYQEARSSSSINHRNIIAIDDFGELPDGRIYMCMELLNGSALNDLIMQVQPVDRMLNILIQTGHGLAAAHAKNIVHRDMKPENIFVTIGPNNEDVPKILDFGIAKVSGNDGQNNLTRTGTIFGTPFYMAPEQALGNPVDQRTDIYAVGVIMYEVFSGTLPFQGESFMGILTQHITTEPEPVAQRAAKANRPMPPGLADIITCCMHKNPAQRFQKMDDLVNALIQIYRGVAGAGMSTYMEAFPVSSQHPVPTPASMTAPVNVGHGPNVHSATMAAGPPPSSGGYAMPHHTPTTGHAQAIGPSGSQHVVSSSGSGLYDPSASQVAPKKTKAGLLIAIFAVLAVGGGITAFVLLGNKTNGGGDGSGSQLASGDSGGTDGTAAGTGGSSTKVGGGTGTVDGGSVTVAHDAAQQMTTGTPDAAQVASATPDAAETTPAAPDAAPQVVDVPVDAGPIAAKMVQVPLFASGVNTFEVWENGAKLFDGPFNLEVPEGGKRTVVIKAKNYKDKTITVDTTKKRVMISLSRIPPVVTNPPPAKCTGTKADLKSAVCRPIYCKDHDDPLCGLE